MQRAIWALVDDAQSTAGLGPWSQCRVDEILASVLDAADAEILEDLGRAKLAA